MRFKPRFFIGGGLVAAAVIYLTTTAIRNTAEYYLTVPEVAARAQQLTGQALRVAGRVKPGSVSWEPSSLKLSFKLVAIPEADGTGSDTKSLAGIRKVNDDRQNTSAEFLVVSVGQPKPDMFAENRDVIVEGELTSGHTIMARQVLTSCPSKYVPASKK